jgi:hypothetical protein
MALLELLYLTQGSLVLKKGVCNIFPLFFLNSPRSLEACRRQGIYPEDLVVRGLEEIKDIYGEKNVDKHSLDVRAQHYENRRKDKIKIVTQVRVI